MYDISSINSELKLDYFLQDDVCRLCWNKRGTTELIYDSKAMEINSEYTGLLHVIQDCLDIKVSPGSRPNKLCSLCVKNLRKFLNFKSFCRETDRILFRIFQYKDEKYDNLLEIKELTLKEEPKTTDNLEISEPNSPVLEDVLDLLPSDDEIPLNKLKSSRKYKTSNSKKTKKHSTFCRICNLQLLTKNDFIIHNEKFHNVVDGQYRCFGCKEIFETRKERLKHEQIHSETLKDSLRCNLCECTFPSQKDLDKHLRSHHNNQKYYKCKICLETYQTKKLLTIHSRCHAQKKKKYVCEHCGRVFARPDYLHKHRLIHAGSKQHACPHCSYRTVQRSSLTVHIRKHTGERPFKCDLCPQRCVSSSNLRAHRRVHAAAKLFQCKICDKKFGYKASLEEHVSVSHELQSRSFVCPDCGSAYSRARGLRQHVKKKHEKVIQSDGANDELRKSDVGVDSVSENGAAKVEGSCGFVLLGSM